MKQFINFSVDKIITVLMVVVAVIVFGVVSFNRLTTDLFPDVNIPYAVVVTTYPGATPDEVEQNVSVPLENVFQTTTNIREVTTQSQENYSMVMLEFAPDADMDTALVEMRENLNLILDDLPDEAGNPAILRLNPEMLPIMNFSVSYEGKDLEELTEWTENTLSPRLERIPGVANLTISGAFESEIRVTLDQESIDEYNEEIEEEWDDLETIMENLGIPLPEDMPRLTLDKEHVGNVLQAQNFAFPSGFIEVDGTEYMVRVGDDLGSLDDIKELTVFDLSTAAIPAPISFPKVSVSDIAEVDFVDARDRQYSKVNGENALTVSIQKGGDYATTDVTENIHAAFAELAEEDDDFEVTVLLDQGEYINMATGSVVQNLIIGGILAIIVLFVFLRSFRMTFIVGVAIPISLLFAIILIYVSGMTLNIVSLGGLALGIGMLVDNSIVVIENIFRMKKDGATNKEAAVRGAHQVSGAIIASTLTTIGVFLPIMFIEDFIREIFVQLALTISFSLFASLLIALTFVPTIANRILREEDEEGSEPVKPKTTPFFEKIKGAYAKVLEGLFKVKAVVVAVVLGLFVASFFLATSRGFQFFPPTDEGTLRATLEITAEEPMGFEEFSTKLDELYEDLREYDDIETIGISLGGEFAMLGFTGGTQNSANINIVLRDDRRLSTAEMAEEVQTLLETDYDMFESSVTGTEADAAALIGEGVQVRLKGPELETLREEAVKLADLLEDVEGTADVDSGLGIPQQEIKVTVDKDAAIRRGFTVAQVLQQVAEYLSEPEMITNVTMNGRSYNLYIYDEDESKRTSIEDLDELRGLSLGTSPIGTEILLEDIAEVGVQTGYTRITRVDGARSITVDASIASGHNTSIVARDIEAVLDDYELPSGYDYEVLGEDEEIMAAIDTLILVGTIGILLVYMIMASQFQSLTYPFIIMFTIPLAFTGGFSILYVLGMPVSIVAIIGLIILSGVVVNNGIVLVDYINQLRARGYELKEAIFEAGKVRLRPIFMTALTTILALTTLAIGFGQGAELTQPMAITAIGGLFYATFLTIFLVPIMYHILTLHGRYVFGLPTGLIAIGMTIYYLVVGNYFYAFIGFVLAALVATIVLFLPENGKTEGRLNE